MRKNMLKYRNIILLVLAFVVGSGAGFYWPTSAQDPTTTRNSQEIPTRPPTSVQQLETKNVIFEQQPDSPLQPVEVLAASYPQQNEFIVKFRNISNKSIRAYVLKKLIYDSPQDNQPLEINSLQLHLKKDFYDQPASDVDEYLTGTSLEASKVLIKVDYVEFEDGTTWGQDISSGRLKQNNRKLIAASWAGALTATQKLIKMVETQGWEALIKNSDPDLTASHTMPEDQKHRFKSTSMAVQSLVKSESQESLETAKILLQSMHAEYQRIAEQQLAAKEQQKKEQE
jgi:hypothetical protein